MEDEYRIKHIYNYILRGSRWSRGRFSLAKLVLLEDAAKEFHLVLLCNQSEMSIAQDPAEYLDSHLPGRVSTA